MKRPAQRSRKKSAPHSEASDRFALRVALGIAITVCLVAIAGGVGYVVLPMTRQLAESAGDSDAASSSEHRASAATGFANTETVDSSNANNYEVPASSSGDTMDESEFEQTSNPFEASSYETVSEPSTDLQDGREYASATERGARASDDGVGDVARSGVTVPGVAVSGVRTPLDLVDSMKAWHDQPNRDLKAIRKISGDNLAVYAHYSWMTELLPHLGHQAVYDKFDFGESWLDEKNLQLSGELIPQFQNPSDKRQRWKGFPFENMALTHFVGMSGIEDRRNVVAAKLPRSDPRAGIFGYDDVAKRDEITDGESNTIMLIGSGKLASPWVAGGGATVRGAREPYFDELTGFGSQGGTRAGAISVMADGSVRMISADIDPSVFRAMSTIHGGESVDGSQWMSPATLTK